MAGSVTAATNANGYVDRFIDSSGNVIYIEPQTYHDAVEAAKAATASANEASKSANDAAKLAVDNAAEAGKVASDFNAAEATRVANDIRRGEATYAANAAADAANKAASAANAAARQANAAAAATKPYYMQAAEPARDKRVDGMLWMQTNESTKKIAAFNRWDADAPGTALWPGSTTFPSSTTYPDQIGAWTPFTV